jgi:hypothetical protein
MSIILMCGSIANLGTFFVSIITQFVGAQIAVGSLGILLALVATICLIFIPWVRKLD